LGSRAEYEPTGRREREELIFLRLLRLFFSAIFFSAIFAVKSFNHLLDVTTQP
jgi:hypothetical protein